jgi:3-mercaptopyruvate sulfurtransferase SseA
MLKERNVPDVRALTGGWNDWVKDGNPVEKSK